MGTFDATGQTGFHEPGLHELRVGRVIFQV
jgi:hypothetical protein